MKSLLIFSLLFFTISSFATEYMLGFDAWKALTGINHTTSNYQYNDDYEDETDTSFSLAILFGRRLSEKFQLLGLLGHDKYEYDDGEESLDTEFGLGLEYNFKQQFYDSYYTSFMAVSAKYVVERDYETRTTNLKKYYFTFGRRFPLIGNKGFLTYSPDINYIIEDYSSKSIVASASFVVNFLKLDILF